MPWLRRPSLTARVSLSHSLSLSRLSSLSLSLSLSLSSPALAITHAIDRILKAKGYAVKMGDAAATLRDLNTVLQNLPSNLSGLSRSAPA